MLKTRQTFSMVDKIAVQATRPKANINASDSMFNISSNSILSPVLCKYSVNLIRDARGGYISSPWRRQILKECEKQAAICYGTSERVMVNGGRHERGSERLKKFEWETVVERQIMHAARWHKRTREWKCLPPIRRWVCGLWPRRTHPMKITCLVLRISDIM